MAPRRYADVALPLPPDHAFTYEIPSPLIHRACVGMRATVPFTNRYMTGYIVALKDVPGVESTKPILDLPDEGPVVTADLLKLCEWIAAYYCCSLGEAIHCALPAGIHTRTKMRYTLVHDQLTQGRYTDRQRKVIAALYRRGPLTEGQLAKEVGRSALSNTTQSLVKRGVILAEALVQESGVSIRTETWAVLVEEHVPPNDGLEELQRRAPKQAAVYFDLLHGESERSATSLYQKHDGNSAILAALEKKGLIRREEREFFRSPGLEADPQSREKHPLNPEQQTAYNAITSAMDACQFATFLIKGITGSGKTEVYLQCIEHALDTGKDAIILVPEISLTPQTVGRFLARFDAQIAVLHSGLAPGERYDEWRRAHTGKVHIVVGARSAIFAPLPNVGIVVVDEEHDTSYKQSETPRYHARDVAIMRAKLNNAVCVLGSATPSIESYYNSEEGKSERLELTVRATQSSLPEVRIVDMRVESKESAGQVVLSQLLDSEIRKRIDAGEQVMLLHNRRGHSPFVLCPQCGWVAYCLDCQVSLTYHAQGAFLSCHYCNARHSVPQVCNECHFNPLIYLGTGTQKVEDFLQRAYPTARIERMDRDTTAGRGGHAKILGRFASGEIDILLGTQMIAKGHDYPGVTLVGVVSADAGLSIPDFRASEIVFQLLTQVAGRAGRGEKPGLVVVQTFRPHHYAVLNAAAHDYGAFYRHEIEERRKAAYPPFRRMVNFSIESEDLLEAERYTGLLHRIVREQIEELGFEGIQLLGPAPATIRRLKKKYRWNLGAFSKSAKRLNDLTRATRAQFNPQASKRVLLKTDLDPYGMF